MHCVSKANSDLLEWRLQTLRLRMWIHWYNLVVYWCHLGIMKYSDFYDNLLRFQILSFLKTNFKCQFESLRNCMISNFYHRSSRFLKLYFQNWKFNQISIIHQSPLLTIKVTISKYTVKWTFCVFRNILLRIYKIHLRWLNPLKST